MNTPTLITVAGPTAIGKTALGITLANAFNSEIISSDSRQFFKEMTIGTAVPEPEELEAAKHHFIQNLSIHDTYSVGEFERDALSLIQKKLPSINPLIMVGGSGLYNDAVVKGLDYFPDIDPSVRIQLQKTLEDEGIEPLQKQLETLDPSSFKTIAIDNPQRLIRALEVSIGAEHPYSFYKNKPKAPRPFQVIKLGLNAPREMIYDRINRRVEIMFEKGLLEEATKLYPHRNLNALQTVGYREIFSYLDGNGTLEFAKEEIKKNTRRFAKRQLTWCRKDAQIHWFDFQTPREEIIDFIKNTM